VAEGCNLPFHVNDDDSPFLLT